MGRVGVEWGVAELALQRTEAPAVALAEAEPVAVAVAAEVGVGAAVWPERRKRRGKWRRR